MWIKSETCEQIISDLWGNSVNNDPNSFLMRELEHCKLGLINWSRKEFGDISNKISKLEKEIDKKSIATGDVRTRLAGLREELFRLHSAEEIKWKQHGKAAWLAEGDRNTAFFHAKASQRNKTNQIDWLKDEDGIWRDDVDAIQDIIQSYFQTIFHLVKSVRS
ncbi:UNVERIFIED_CONTAM: hypothetical protein Slati_4192500 [Sesamum latifolium]|uniref:Uncharacterized protein n=1 Tax=Sesamum latifolium TaxID=2727402 RepID=A0AAW2TDC8_9LAMI